MCTNMHTHTHTHNQVWWASGWDGPLCPTSTQIKAISTNNEQSRYHCSSHLHHTVSEQDSSYVKSQFECLTGVFLPIRSAIAVNLTKDLKKPKHHQKQHSYLTGVKGYTRSQKRWVFQRKCVYIYDQLLFECWNQLFRFVTEAFSSKSPK